MYLRELDANLIVVLDALLIDASVTKAAERLGRSPSAVSHALSNLRMVFEDDLFVRAGQRLVPTAKAKEMAPTIHVIVAGMEGLVRPTAPFDPGTQKRNFTISSPEISELTILHGLRGKLASAAPGITIERRPPANVRSVEGLRDGGLDFIIQQARLDDDAPDITSEGLYDDPVVTLARKGHPLARKKLSLAAFAEAAHIEIEEGSDTRDTVAALIASKGRELNIVRTVTSPLVGACLALETDALVSIPGTAAHSIMKAMPLVVIKQPFASLSVAVFMSWHRSKEPRRVP